MRNIFFSIIIIVLVIPIKSQTVVSTCTAPESILNICNRDASKLTLARTVTINSTYKDSIVLNRLIYNRYLNALIAVYNATTLPMLDTLNLLGIHANLRFQSNNDITVQADSNLAWMKNIKNNIAPCGNSIVDNIINRCYFKKVSYTTFSSSNFVNLAFKTDTGCNMTRITNILATIPGVNYIIRTGFLPGPVDFDGSDIIDSVTTNYIDLTYLVQWGDCPSGCTYRTRWKFRVYNNCTVEYLGRHGTPVGELLAGISTLNNWKQNLTVFPNPVKDKLHFEGIENQKLKFNICNTLGQTMYSKTDADLSDELDVSFLRNGIYYLKLENNKERKVFKIIKE